MKPQYVYTIKSDDIGKTVIKIKCNCCNTIKHYISITDLMGKILPCDIGKRIYEVSKGIYQVENDEQLNLRLNREKYNLIKTIRGY